METQGSSDYLLKETIVIGAGISGIAVSRWLKEYKLDFLVIEKSDDIAGLWRYRNDDYGVMECTHINVSKYNYCFSDHSFPDDCADYPHHTEMYKYVRSYADKHKLFDNIQFKSVVVSVEELEEDHKLSINRPSFQNVKFYDRLWKVKVKSLETNKEQIYVTPYVSVASGHHATPTFASFPGQNTFTGEIFHSVKYKSPKQNNLIGKKVLIVGIGNSAVDIAVNLVNQGSCPKVTISTRSGAWIIPNYIAGLATDLYACRVFLNLPWRISTLIFETVVKFIYGDPKNYNLNPKMRALQTQPTVSPTIIHHLQRRNLNIQPNIQSINGDEVTFENGKKEKYDTIVLCTGYKIDLSFLSSNLRSKVFADSDESTLNLFKHVFNPEIGRSLSFIGFIQPSSGGLLTVSEVQARWFVQLLMNRARLPGERDMMQAIIDDQKNNSKRFHNSKRHTIQQDPITYNSEITSYFGAKPDYLSNLGILWRLLFGSCGPAQWRLNGPDADKNAVNQVKKVPVTGMMKIFCNVMLSPVIPSGILCLSTSERVYSLSSFILILSSICGQQRLSTLITFKKIFYKLKI